MNWPNWPLTGYEKPNGTVIIGGKEPITAYLQNGIVEIRRWSQHDHEGCVSHGRWEPSEIGGGLRLTAAQCALLLTVATEETI